jgi:hypothetical protein
VRRPRGTGPTGPGCAVRRGWRTGSGRPAGCRWRQGSGPPPARRFRGRAGPVLEPTGHGRCGHGSRSRAPGPGWRGGWVWRRVGDGERCGASHDWAVRLRAQRRWLVVERLPAYAPDLNPLEGLRQPQRRRARQPHQRAPERHHRRGARRHRPHPRHTASALLVPPRDRTPRVVALPSYPANLSWAKLKG